jgi:hypothetical protein
MRSNLFWLDDEQWGKIQPLLPTDVRGKDRADDRRHFACSQERLPVVRLSAGIWPAHNDLQSLHALG